MVVLRLKIKQKTTYSQIFSTYWLGPTRTKIRIATAGEWPAQEYMGYSKFERLHIYQQQKTPSWVY